MHELTDQEASQQLITRANSLFELVRSHADQAEQVRYLPNEVAQAFAHNELYRIAAPIEIGGYDIDPATQIKVIEAISRADGSAGWNLMIGIETFGLVSPAMSGCWDLVKDPRAIMASSTAAVGTAERAPDGWLINGQWQFVSGIHNAHVFGATVRLHENGEQIDKLLRYALLDRDEFEIVDTWNVSGLRGSGSHDVRINNVWVPDRHVVAAMGDASNKTRQLLIPLGVRLTFNKVGVGFGIARAAIDAFIELANGKTPRFSNQKLRDRPYAQRSVARAETRLRGSRAAVLEHAERVWECVQNETTIDEHDRAMAHILCSDAAAAVVECVEIIVSAAGTTANQLGHPLERISRDVRVIRQHATVAPHHIDDAARVLMGHAPQGILLR